ncbi:MAG: transcription-repair coupling factor [Bacteroidales bacterium]|nr:transcription-repair coupling factor [Bacteroidales bacterium]
MELQKLVELYKKHPLVGAFFQNFKTIAGSKVKVKGLSGSASSLVIQNIFSQSGKNIFVILSDKDEAAYLYNDLEKLLPPDSLYFLPSSFKKDFANSGDYKKSEGNIILRNRTIESLSSQKQTLIVSYTEALLEKEADAQTHASASFAIHAGEKLSTEFLNEFLQEYGFKRNDFVFGPGDFSIRGSIIDVFSYSDENPYRIDLFGDEVESIRTFDVLNQLSIKNLDKVTIHPDVNNIVKTADKTIILDLLPQDTILWYKDRKYTLEKIQSLADKIVGINEIDEQGNALMINKDNFITAEQFIARSDEFHQVVMGTQANFEADLTYEFKTSKQIDFNKNFDLLAETIARRKEEGFSNYILSGNSRQLERLESILKSDEVQTKVDFIPVNETLHRGFTDQDLLISCYTDHQIFKRFHRVKLIDDKFSENKSAMTLREINSLQPGDFVVHSDYGIGKFGGINTIENNGKKQEAIRIIYKNNDVVFVSIHALHKVSKYRSGDGIPPQVHKLGSGAWQKAKEKTKNKVKDIAKELIALYAKRKDEVGFQYSPDTYLQEALEASFIYEDTPDQAKATRETKVDMESTLPMDRLICGDVGFGKTEIAIRAAFKAVTDGKQVAVLVPTTILALQHYQTFKKRLKDLPCKVNYISRLKSKKKQTELLKELAEGKLDILIGTHRIVGKDVVFKDLGLLVIDEEQKFGVAIKEKLKHLKLNVDTLTLTATPIPRTMQFSLMGARDLSVINTPPPDRYPIITELHTFSEEVLKDAINYEVERNGQVFFIHNRVQNITEIQHLIERICPNVKTVFAHGQMPGNQLESIMMDFINHEYDVLIATTIIESGLDIPNANTIIINDAQNFGLSDLHQLRGRVGRSSKKAYCYLMAPPLSVLSNEARKRLQAIEEFSELGSGFNIAMQDLDIRGAGNLLGGEQSGFIADIGFETYQQILNEALFELREEEGYGSDESKDNNNELAVNRIYSSDCQIDTDLELLFPESYIDNTAERIRLYRELDNIKEEELLKKFASDLDDRFGKIPKQTEELLIAVKLRWLAMRLGFSKILLKSNKMFCYFIADDSSLYFNSTVFSGILNYVNKNPKICRLKEQKEKLTLQIEPVKSIQKAYDVLTKMVEGG